MWGGGWRQNKAKGQTFTTEFRFRFCWLRDIWLWHWSPHSSAGWFSWSGWLGWYPLPPLCFRYTGPEAACVRLNGTTFPETGQTAKGIGVAVLPCQNFQTSFQGWTFWWKKLCFGSLACGLLPNAAHSKAQWVHDPPPTIWELISK